MPYRAVFRCIAGCPGEHALAQPLYRCPHCGDLLEVAHDLAALSGPQRRRVDAPVRRPLQAHRRGPTARRSGARRNGCAPTSATSTSSRWTRAAPTCFWAERFGRDARTRRPVGQAVRQLAHRLVQGPRHDRAGVDGQADDRRRQHRAGRRLRVDRRHLGGAGGLRRRGRHSGAGAPAARQGLHGAAGAAAGQRRDWCWRSTPTSTAAWPSSSGSPSEEGVYLANSMNTLRLEGQKTVADRDRPAVRLAGARRGDHPRRQPRQRQRARRRLRHARGARAHPASAPRIVVAQAAARPTRSTSPTSELGRSSR